MDLVEHSTCAQRASMEGIHPLFGKAMRLLRVKLLMPVALLLGLLAPLQLATPAQATTTTESGGQYVALSRFRLDGLSTNLAAGEVRQLQVLGTGGIPSTGVGAVVIDVAVVSTTATNGSNIKVYSTDEATPTYAPMKVSTDTAPKSMTMVVVPGSDGKVSLLNQFGSTNLNIDVQGYFTSADNEATSAGGFVPLAEWYQALHTLDGTGAPQAPLGAGQSITVQITGSQVPSGSQAIFAGVIVRGASASGSLRISGLSPSAEQNRALVNYGVSTTPVSQGVAVPLSGTGTVTVTNDGSASVDVTLLVQGYFTPSSSTGAGFQAIAGTHILNEVTLSAGEQRDVQLLGVGDLPMPTVTAAIVYLKRTASSGTGNGLLVFRPAGATTGFKTALAWKNRSSAIATSTAIVKPGTLGMITLRNDNDGPVTVSLEATGYFADTEAVPSAPTNVSYATNGSGADVVSWTAPTSFGTSASTGYIVQDGLGNSYTAAPGATQLTIASPASGRLGYAVAATNSAGIGEGVLTPDLAPSDEVEVSVKMYSVDPTTNAETLVSSDSWTQDADAAMEPSGASDSPGGGYKSATGDSTTEPEIGPDGIYSSADEPPCINSTDYRIFCGKVTGSTCAVLEYTMTQKSTTGLFTNYRWWHRVNWCRVSSTSNYISSWKSVAEFRDMDWVIEDKGQTRKMGTYSWGGSSRGGLYVSRKGHAQSTIPIVGTTMNKYPIIHFWVHGDLSWKCAGKL